MTKILLLILMTLPLTLYGKGNETVLVRDGQNPEFKVELIASDLDVPWGMVFIDQSQLLLTEKSGSVKVLDIKNRELSLVGRVADVFDKGQGGLLDVAIPPGFKKGDWIYFTYSKDMDGNGSTTLAKARLMTGKLVDWTDLLITRSNSNSGVHFGSRIAFDEKGHIYFTVGERGKRPNAQDLNTHAGSILRVTLEGKPARDNPFSSSALVEIWSYGHRNPQGIVYDKENKRLWSIEHGPRGGDELNLILPGRNYGWPVVSHGKEYWGPIKIGEGTEKKGMENPVKVYIPSIAPSSLILYAGDAFQEWQGNLFSGALAKRHLNRTILDPSGKPVGEERLLEQLNERIRSLVVDSNGYIYLSTDSGKIFCIKPN